MNIKKRIKQLFRVYMLFIGLIICTGCQKEKEVDVLLIEDFSSKTETRLNVQDVPSLTWFISKYMNDFTTKSTEYGLVIETPLGMIQMEDILQVKNLEGNSNYSLNIISSSLTNCSVYNLIIDEGAEGEDPEAYILEYLREKSENGIKNNFSEVTRYAFEGINQRSLNKTSDWYLYDIDMCEYQKLINESKQINDSWSSQLAENDKRVYIDTHNTIY